MFKLDDKVVRKPAYRSANGWAHNDAVLTVLSNYDGAVAFKELPTKWTSYYFERYVEPAKETWTPKYAVGDKVMPAKCVDWQSPAVITRVRCTFVYETDKQHITNVPEESLAPFVQGLRTVFIDGVLYKEVK